VAKDYKIYTKVIGSRKIIVEIVGETPEAMRAGRDKYLRQYPHFGYNTTVTFETSTTCEITRWTSCD
jgi:hypothetical protein